MKKILAALMVCGFMFVTAQANAAVTFPSDFDYASLADDAASLDVVSFADIDFSGVFKITGLYSESANGNCFRWGNLGETTPVNFINDAIPNGDMVFDPTPTLPGSGDESIPRAWVDATPVDGSLIGNQDFADYRDHTSSLDGEVLVPISGEVSGDVTGGDLESLDNSGPSIVLLKVNNPAGIQVGIDLGTETIEDYLLEDCCYIVLYDDDNAAGIDNDYDDFVVAFCKVPVPAPLFMLAGGILSLMGLRRKMNS